MILRPEDYTDSFASTGLGLIGCNMFAYCNNNPSNYSDSSGALPYISHEFGSNVMVLQEDSCACPEPSEGLVCP